MEKKFYVVKIGRNTGIFESWEECKEQIYKFKGAIYKSFFTFSEAEDFLDGKKTSSPTKYYAVKKGKKIGIFESWEECKEQITSYRGAVFQSFLSYNDAQSYLSEIEKKEISSNKKKSIKMQTKKRKTIEILEDEDEITKPSLTKSSDDDLLII